MIKTFTEMMKVDVSKYLKERDGSKYLPWARCKELLHLNGAETVYFEPCTNDNGSSLFMSDQTFTDKNGITNKCYEVRVKITIDSDVFYMQTPVMNGGNPVKDNSMTQQRVWNAQTRAFVKGVAMKTGLGFSLWLDGEDDGFSDEFDDVYKHSLFSIRERLQQEYTAALMKHGRSTRELAAALEMTEDEIKTCFTFFDQLDRLEKKLIKI